MVLVTLSLCASVICSSLYLYLGIPGFTAGWWEVAICLYCGFWLLNSLKCWKIPGILFLVIMHLAAITVFFRYDNSLYMILTCYFGVSAWNLDDFRRFLLSAEKVVQTNDLVRRHIAYLIAILAASLTLSLVLLQIDRQIGLYTAMFLVVVLIVLFPKITPGASTMQQHF